VRVEVVADHEHVQVLFDGVLGIRQRGVGGGRKHIGQPGNLDDVRGVAAACAFRVEGVNDPAVDRFDGVDGVFHETALVEGVRVNRHLDVVFVGHAQGHVNGGRGGAPILMDFEPDGTGADRLGGGCAGGRVA